LKAKSSWPADAFLASSENARWAETQFALGTTIYLSVGYANLGGLACTKDFTVRITLFDASGARIGGNEHREKDCATFRLYGGTKVFWDSAAFEYLQNLAAGQYTLRLMVDADREVAESNETNNVREIVFTVR
jgi:hypothetical protein